MRRVKERYTLDRGGKSSGNVVEAAFVVRLVERVLSLYGDEVSAASIGVITFYQQQKRLHRADAGHCGGGSGSEHGGRLPGPRERTSSSCRVCDRGERGRRAVRAAVELAVSAL